MKKIKTEMGKLTISKEEQIDLKEEFIKLLKEEGFKKITDSLPFNDEILMKYTTKLQEAAKEYQNCLQCKGLMDCQNSLTGYIYTPEVLGSGLSFGYRSCHYQEELLKAKKYQKNSYYFDVPLEIKEARMKNIYTSDKNRVEVLAWIKDFMEKYEKGNYQKGLYLYGNFGSGKTFLLSAMLNELANKNYKTAIIYWPEFLRDLKASFSSDFAEKYDYIKKVSLLLIDDIGAENVTSWSRDEILGPLLQYRMQEKLPTFFTSNLSIKELDEHFSFSNYKTEKVKGRRIIERIEQLSLELKMVSKNRRK
ncbi:MAG: primosomal protein DnaI [Bacilli bacterium]|jgi:primosomal protein DnaI